MSQDPAPPAAVPEADSLWTRIDRAVYHAERVLAWSLFLGMAILTFVAVVHRVFSRTEGRFSTLLLHWFGHAADPASAKFFHGPVSSVFNVVAAFCICLIAVRTTKRVTPLAWGRALVYAVLLTGALGGGVELVLILLPNGLVWSGPVSLACMLWVGFLGASMATYERRHLAIEMGEKIWPKKLVPYVRAFAAFMTAFACAFLLVLCWLSVKDHFGNWSKTHAVGVLDYTALPYWSIFSIFLWTFAVMTLRFLRAGVRAVTHPNEAPPDLVPAGVQAGATGEVE